MEDQEPNWKEAFIEGLKHSTLTPKGIEYRKTEIKTLFKFWLGSLFGFSFLFLFLYDIKVNNSFYDLGIGAAILLGMIVLLCFLAAIIAPFYIYGAWREIRQAQKKK